MPLIYLIKIIFLTLIALGFAWKYYDLQRHVDEYSNSVRQQPTHLPVEVMGLES